MKYSTNLIRNLPLFLLLKKWGKKIQNIHLVNEWYQLSPWLRIESTKILSHESSADLSAFPWQILMKCLEIYLWTKNNWSGESALGGENNQNWLQAIHHKIIDREWMIALID